jgi:hypothetical protein
LGFVSQSIYAIGDRTKKIILTGVSVRYND